MHAYAYNLTLEAIVNDVNIHLDLLRYQLLGPVYTKRQHQCYHNSVVTLVILFSLKTMESLQNGF